MLHGKLQQVRLDTGVRWARGDLTQPVDFRPDNMAWIRFEGARPVERNRDPSVHIRFHNGDEVLGNLIALDGQRVQFSTWFNEQLSAPRDVLQSLAFLSPGFRILYEGPTTMAGWRLGWMVVPDYLADPIANLAQNLYLCASAPSQIGALHAIDCRDELDGHVKRYRRNREILLDRLPAMGFDRFCAPAVSYTHLTLPTNREV